jgi:tRNA-dihydrouridine synthase A
MKKNIEEKETKKEIETTIEKKEENIKNNDNIKEQLNEINEINNDNNKENEKELEDVIISKENKYHNPSEHKYNLSIAPMLEITTKHYMHFMRLLTKQTLIYSEMINIGEIINKDDALDFSQDLEPLCIQFGGSDPEKCGLAAEKVKLKGFKEININCGCPSKKVSAGNFGAVLMNDPKLVGNCVKEMNKILFSSIKCRLGLNEYKEKFLYDFIETTKNISDCKKYILHSRIAIMGIDTMKNRKVPPLQYDVVEEVKNKYKDLNIVINGGIKDFDVVREFNNKNIGVMIGREAYDNPWKFRNADSQIFGKCDPKLTRKQVVYEYADYCQKYIDEHPDSVCSGLLGEMIKPLSNLFTGEKYNKVFTNKLYEITHGSKDQNKKKELLKKYEKIRDHLYSSIEAFEKENEEAVLSI